MPFWHDGGRLTAPAWTNGLPEKYLTMWEESGRSPTVLAAVKWMNIIELTRADTLIGPARYIEVKYKDLTSDPNGSLKSLSYFCGLPPSVAQQNYLAQKIAVKNYNQSSRDKLTEHDRTALNTVMVIYSPIWDILLTELHIVSKGRSQDGLK